MKKLLLFSLILIYKHSYTQALVTLYNGVTVNKDDTLYAGFSHFQDRYIGYQYYYVIESTTQSQYSNNTIKYLSCTDKLIVISYEQLKEKLLCKNTKNNKKFYVDINSAVQKKEIFTNYVKYGLNKNYYGIMEHYLIISKDASYNVLHSKYPNPLYTNENLIYLWYQQSSLPEYAKIKKYVEIKYHNDCSKCTNEIFNSYKKEVSAKLFNIDSNQIYSMLTNSFQFFNYDSVSSKLKISANESTYSAFKEEFDGFINLKCSNYPSNFFLDINNQKYYSLTKMAYKNNINAIVNYKIIAKSSFDSDNDIRIKITSIDFYDEANTCEGKFLANYFGSISFK